MQVGYVDIQRGYGALENLVRIASEESLVSDFFTYWKLNGVGIMLSMEIGPILGLRVLFYN